MEKKYTDDQLAKYVAITVTGLLQELLAEYSTTKDIRDRHDAVLADLSIGSMEESIKQYDDAVQDARNN